jgi:hypothetical protein
MIPGQPFLPFDHHADPHRMTLAELSSLLMAVGLALARSAYAALPYRSGIAPLAPAL